MREINLDRLRTLLTVADLGSFAAAAKVLHLAPPTVTLHVAQLEERLGTRLLHRAPAGVTATSAGSLLIDKARQLLAEADDLLQTVQRQIATRGGRVRLGASTGALAHLLPQALETLAARHPEIDVQVAVMTSEEALARLAAGSLDIGIVALPQPVLRGLQVQAWRSSLTPAFQISINTSPVQFQHTRPPETNWVTRLAAMGLPGDSLSIEITEGVLLDSTACVTAKLLEWRDAGIQVALDDFGTGYSSLSYLQKFDIDFIKIDQSFVRDLQPNSTNHTLCKAIMAMAHALGLQVVAEGVETAQQRDLLLQAGCDYAQGYWFARPMPAEALADWVAGRA